MKTELEEAAERSCESITHPYCDREKSMFIKGAKWQAERSYNEEDMHKYAIYILTHKRVLTPDEWREQFKKK
jgi:hypothetical protein